MNTVHSGELTICGCRVDPQTSVIFTKCARHACDNAILYTELPVEGIEPLPVHKAQPSIPLCPGCGSVRIKVGKCLECGEEFEPSEVVGVSEPEPPEDKP